MKINIINRGGNKGLVLINVLIFAMIAVTVTLSLIGWATTMIKSSRQLNAREQAFQAAEAGIDYYRWHLAHAPTDYKDGNATTTTGPFIHPFKDKDGNVIGEFALTITPPPPGSTVVKIKSKGTVIEDPAVSRTIQVTLAIPSLARYAVAANDIMRFGAGTEVFGPIHSNNGIRFDGIAHNVISSAKDKYIDPDLGTHTPAWYQFGVYTTDSPSEVNNDSTPPTTVPTRSDVFLAGRQFPVPAIDFVGMTTDLSNMKALAQQPTGYYRAASGALGYHVVLKTTDKFDIYRVNSTTNASNSCEDDGDFQTNWGTWSVQNQTLLQANVDFPENATMFFEDHVWVDGQINTARLTIAAGRFPDSPSTRRSITVNNDILYTNYDSQDTLALIAQGDINVGLVSENDLRIDAALIAQNGRVGRYYYSNDCGSNYIRNSVTLFGMIASNLRYGFAYTNGTGYQDRTIVYDTNLLYAPPPNFPLTSDQYTTISWDEIK
jgi:hypothetical protein